MAWRKITKQAVPTTGLPDFYSALGSIFFDSATNTLYMMTAANCWSVYTWNSTSREYNGQISMTATVAGLYEPGFEYVGDITMAATVSGLYEYYPEFEYGGDITMAATVSGLYELDVGE